MLLENIKIKNSQNSLMRVVWVSMTLKLLMMEPQLLLGIIVGLRKRKRMLNLLLRLKHMHFNLIGLKTFKNLFQLNEIPMMT